MTQSALLLAAGKATRLGELRERYAKACVPIAGTTPLAFLLERLLDAGVTHFCINLHWQAEQVREVAREAVADRAELLWLEEERLLGTGGSLLAAAELLGVAPDLAVNAKQFGDLNWQQVLQAPAGTLVVHPQSSLDVFGGLRYRAPEMRLLGLQSRSNPTALGPEEKAAVYTGIARVDPSWMRALESASGHELRCLARHGFLPHLAAGGEVTILEHHGWWCEISTPERVREAESLVAAGRH